MYRKKKRRKNAPIQRSGSQGFPEGLNTLAHPSTLKDTELSELVNGIYSQYGSISKRQGSTIIGEAIESGTEILQLRATYNIAGASRLIRISDVGKPEYYDFDAKAWGLLSADAPDGYSGSNPTFTAGTPTFDTTTTTWIVQIGNRLYFANAVNDLVWLEDDGWHIYTALANPGTKPQIVKTGAGAGSTKFFYQIVWYNEAGGTLASDPADADVDAELDGWIGSLPQQLDTDTYLTLTLPEAPAGCTRVGIFKSNRQGEAFFLDDVEPEDITYVDKGEIGTDTFYGVPDANTTGGYHFTLLDSYKGSLVGVTTELGSDTLVWSGAYDKYGSFALPDGAGFFPYRAGDGSSINAIKAHVASNQDSLFIFKDNVFGKFQFLAVDGDFIGEGRVQDVNISVGSISPLSPHVAGNNLRFWSRDGAATVGNEANYGTILRYSVLSLRADSIVQRVTPANLNQVSGVFFKSLSLFGISTDVAGGGNNAVLAYDERYNSWSLFTGVYATVWAKYINPDDQVEKLYYGSSLTADVLEMFNGKTDYATSSGAGTPITLSLSTKQYDLKLPDQFKKFDKVTLVFGTLTGNSTSVGIIKADHKGITSDPRLKITQETVLSGFGNDEWGDQEVGNMSEEDAGSSINIKYINLKQKDLFWIKVNIQNNGIEDQLSIIGIYVYYSKSTRPLTFGMKLRDLA
ncbi:MAG TPA: hypothetical protein ENI23_00960 [bacterium]|nr:hypothetical protein [bacterium]